MSEFDFIRQLLADLPGLRDDVVLGPGDDAALLQPPPGDQLAMTTDTLIAGRHFPDDADPASVGWKSVAVNISDLAAMGARPAWITMTVSTPDAAGIDWRVFMSGVARALQAYGVSLVGGDLTRGPWAITVCALGFIRPDQALRRDGARAGDVIAVTGTLGDAALGLSVWQSPQAMDDPADAPARDFLTRRLHWPEARVQAGVALTGLATAAADVSDGLAADLGHILTASGVGAEVDAACLPRSPALSRLCRDTGARQRFQLSGGDDYELCVTLPEERLAEAVERVDVPLTVIGRVTRGSGLRVRDGQGALIELERAGYDHFAGSD